MASWSLSIFSLKEEQRNSYSPQRQDLLLHSRQPHVLQLFPFAMRKEREQGGVGQGRIGLLGDRCEAGSVLHPAALQLEGQPGEPREWCSCCQAPLCPTFLTLEMHSVWLLGWWLRKWHCPEPLVSTARHWSLQSCPSKERWEGAVPAHRVCGLARGSSGLDVSRV